MTHDDTPGGPRPLTRLLRRHAIRYLAYAVMFPVGRFVLHMSWLQMAILAAMYEVWEWILIPAGKLWLARRDSTTSS